MSGTSTASEQVQQAAGGAGGGAAAGGVAAAGIGGGGGGGGGSSAPPSAVGAAADGGGAVGGGTGSTASAVSLSAAALAQEGSDGLGALKGSSPGGSPYRGSPRGGPTLTRSQTLGPNAASSLDEKRERPSGLSRVFNPPKLERKHSSGDLHSRLKTRKILGVGETDNGDIHRSKISQVLGHNEHLYVKLPRGFWSAHVAMGVGVTLEAGLLLLTPGLASRLGIMPYGDDDDDDDDATALRVAGAALAGLCVFVWSLLGTSDKHYARTMLLSMLTYQILSICVSAGAALTQQEPTLVLEEEGGAAEGRDEEESLLGSRLALCVGLRALMCLLCLAYFYSIGKR
ncbi:tumor protein p53-inducible protein 11-like isoform X3 [Portunus trituberculatus]|uniref:tumor protein p53-inducible protein 11-like isoform X3 n=1 Tax=Portunus trituberculatus TaxID=210409 RepID=UPI001E1CBA65|nr:tumor protein p53-inducible protein 11-like isoform X3 [Portunus trituberculatus]